MTRLFLILLLLLSQGCSEKPLKRILIGFDPDWAPLNFGIETAYINGFVQDLLLFIAEKEGFDVELISANSGRLYQGLFAKEYNLVLGSISRHDFHQLYFSISDDFLHFGPVLIVLPNAQEKSLEEMKGKVIGTMMGDSSESLAFSAPGVIFRSVYRSAPELLKAVCDEEIDGALLDWIPAASYLGDLFEGRLKVVGPPLTDQGLRIIGLKEDPVIKKLNHRIQEMKKRGELEAFSRKWSLFPSA